MSNYETSASITLEVNGKNAEDRLKALRQRAEDLENALARARNTGDKIEMNKLQKELKKTNKEIREMSSSAQQAESVMRRLDRATPRELSKTLSTLRKQLDNIERGSAAWNAQIEKIKAVQRELNSVKGSMKEHESSGTNKLFDLAALVIGQLDFGYPLIVDELDSKLHPLLTQHIIKLFNNPKTNPKGAQLIFATHDTNLLNVKTFRRDQIWFTEKDHSEATDLYSLAEFREPEGNKIRKDRSFEKDYINGRYGAIPYIKD